jgi:hypothetical protein
VLRHRPNLVDNFDQTDKKMTMALSSADIIHTSTSTSIITTTNTTTILGIDYNNKQIT